MNFDNLKRILKEMEEPGFRFRQIRDAFAKQGCAEYSEIGNIPKKLASELEAKVPALSFSLEKIVSSRDGFSHKALFLLSDGNMIESVLLSSSENEWSACVSSQAGCPLACRFCATGQSGFKRNLTEEEITDQIVFWKNFLKTGKAAGVFSHIVFMGMGEPFLNWLEVKKALHRIISPDFFAFGSRRVSVSTSGIADGIKDLAREFPQVNLALSLVFPDNKMRSEFMPVNKRFNLGALARALDYYIAKTNRKVFLEYVLLAGINDQTRQAAQVADFVNSIENGAKLLHVNLINYNGSAEGFSAPDSLMQKKFLKALQEKRISATIRKSLGNEIGGACGQLGGN